MVLVPNDIDENIIPALENDVVEVNYEDADIITMFMVKFREQYASYRCDANVEIFVSQDSDDRFTVTPLADDWEDDLKINQHLADFLIQHLIRRCKDVCKAKIDTEIVLTSNLKNLPETIQLCKEMAIFLDTVCLYDIYKETN